MEAAAVEPTPAAVTATALRESGVGRESEHNKKNCQGNDS